MPRSKPSYLGTILRVLVGYLVPAATWILVSDRLLLAVASDPEVLTRLQTYKGWFFVAGSAGLIAALLAAELRQRERRREAFQALIEQSSDVILVVADDGALRYVSPSVTRVLGYDVRDLVGTSVLDLVHADDAQLVAGLLPGAGAPRPAEATTARVRHRDGSWRILEAVASDPRPDALVPGVVVNARDITAQRESEDRLRVAERRLEHAHRMEAVGRLAGGVAHDFNNLLTVINGYSDLVLADASPDDRHRADVAEIRRAGERAAELTRQLLAFSRRQVLQPATIDLNATLASTFRMLERLIREDIELVVEPAPSLRPVRADPGQVEQVILNLAVNARDAMPGGGTLVIRTENVEPGVGRAPEAFAAPCVRLSVSDTGRGIDAETLPHIFEPFFTTKGRGEGTGLGLAMVYGIVKQSGGAIDVRSEPGRGTTFEIYFPAAEGEADAAPPAEGTPAQAGAETVLLVEDEDAVRSFVREALRRSGYTVLEARDGDEALRLCGEHGGPIDVVVTDVIMPNMSGPELAERLGGLRPGTPVLFMSGYTEGATLPAAGPSAAAAFLQKPFTADALAHRVREVLDAR